MIPELIVFFSSMTPLDLKLSIPLGLKLGLSLPTTFVFAISGTIIPAAIFLAIIGPLSKFLRKKYKFMDNFFEKLFQKTRKDHSKKFERYGEILILIIVGVPFLPGNGAGAGALMAFLFGVDYWKALSLIVIGTIISGAIITGGLSSIIGIFKIFN